MDPKPGDQARVSVMVALEPDLAFRVFTEEINQWWRHGRRYRIGKDRSMLRLEPGIGGRIYEAFETPKQTQLIESGRVTVWEPPERLVFDWRAVNFAPDEVTEVEVRFEPKPKGTLVTVTHRGWAGIRPDHPARHGQEVPAFIRTMGMWWLDLMSSLREFASNQAPESLPDRADA
jgi:uncharacterized protein YndB with AHSA1/START domain